MKYRKKPVIINAVQWDGTPEQGDWIIEWMRLNNVKGDPLFAIPQIGIKTLEGWMRADPYDWVIQGVAGEFYPCKPDIFAATYENLETFEQFSNSLESLKRWKEEAIPLLELLDRCHDLLPEQAKAGLGESKPHAVEAYLASIRETP